MSGADLIFWCSTELPAKMTSWLHSFQSSNFIIASFREACRNAVFHHKWMSAQTWAEVIAHQYNLSDEKQYNGKDLVKALSLKSSRWLTNMMDIDPNNVPKDHIGIFRRQYKPKKSGTVYCYYSAPQGQAPNKTDGPWYLEIKDAKEILETRITRSNALQLSHETSEIKTSKLVYSPKKKRKFGEEDPPPSPARDAIVLRADSPSLQSSQPPPVKRSDVILNETYWDSSEAKNIFGPTDGEVNALEAVNNQIKLLHEGLETPLSCLF